MSKENTGRTKQLAGALLVGLCVLQGLKTINYIEELENKLIQEAEEFKTYFDYSESHSRELLEDNSKLLEDNSRLMESLETKEQELQDRSRQVEELKGKLSASPSFSFSEAELDLFYRLVEAEAGGEPYAGRVAVANVVLNRIASPKYPNSLREVIYQRNQFEVVSVGTIDTKVPSEETKRAVNNAIAGEKAVGDNVVIFWANYLDRSHPIWAHCSVVKTIGVHNFSAEWK